MSSEVPLRVAALLALAPSVVAVAAIVAADNLDRLTPRDTPSHLCETARWPVRYRPPAQRQCTMLQCHCTKRCRATRASRSRLLLLRHSRLPARWQRAPRILPKVPKGDYHFYVEPMQGLVSRMWLLA